MLRVFIPLLLIIVYSVVCVKISQNILSQIFNDDNSPDITFSWLKTRNMSAYLRPSEHTAMIEPSPCDSNVRVLALVMTAPQNFADREVVRSTWSKQLNQLISTKVVFIIGKYTTNTSIPYFQAALDQQNQIITEQEMREKLKEEAAEYGDMILEDFVDTYLNLTLKISFGLKWIKNSCPQAEFVIKIDDNVFLHPENVARFLKKEILMETAEFNSQYPTKQVKYAMVGNRWDKSPPNRRKNSKYYLPKSMYKDRFLPSFLRGLAYIFTGSLISPLYDCVSKSLYIPGEDVFVTGLCAVNKLKLSLSHHEGFWRGPVKVGGLLTCQLNKAVAVHDFEATEMREIYRTLQDGKTCLKNEENLKEYQKEQKSLVVFPNILNNWFSILTNIL